MYIKSILQIIGNATASTDILLHPSISQNHHWICGPHMCLHMGTTNPMVILRNRRMREGQENEM
jgi:hypothetical protein